MKLQALLRGWICDKSKTDGSEVYPCWRCHGDKDRDDDINGLSSVHDRVRERGREMGVGGGGRLLLRQTFQMCAFLVLATAVSGEKNTHKNSPCFCRFSSQTSLCPWRMFCQDTRVLINGERLTLSVLSTVALFVPSVFCWFNCFLLVRHHCHSTGMQHYFFFVYVPYFNIFILFQIFYFFILTPSQRHGGYMGETFLPIHIYVCICIWQHLQTRGRILHSSTLIIEIKFKME